MGFHFVNPAVFAADGNAAQDSTTPSILVAQPTGNYRPGLGDSHGPARDDDLRLGAVEYVHLGTVGAPGNDSADETSTRRVRTVESDGWGYVPGVGMALHAWVHRGNPDGVFHPTNRTVP